MASVPNGLSFLLKAFFGGCVGCLGAWLTSIVVVGVIALAAGGPALHLAQGAAQGIQLPLVSQAPAGFPGGIAPPGSDAGPSGASLAALAPASPDCYKAVKAWVAKAEHGSPATDFARTDGMFPVVQSPTNCGKVTARLLDRSGRALVEKSYNVIGGGPNGYGNYNPEGNLTPGPYRMQFSYGDTPLATVDLAVR